MKAVSVSARIRPFMPWESDEQSFEIQNETEIGIPSGNHRKSSFYIGTQLQIKEMEFMKFDSIHHPHCTNQDVFQRTVKTLCDNMIETGFNSLLIAYGQTGSGKTYTLLGSPGRKDRVPGVLAMAIQYLMSHPKVMQCTMSAIEIYATGMKKIQMYDLFDPHNVVEGDAIPWKPSAAKKGFSDLKPEDVTKRSVNHETCIEDLILLAYSAGYHAPTGKNPYSSRGHTAFIIEVHLSDDHQCDFVCLDLAGSEGISAITPEFIDIVGEETAKIRRREAGAINYGLQQIQGILKEVGSRKGVQEMRGNGIRKLLWPFVQRRCQPLIHVLFTMSPSKSNLKTTRDTFRVAKIMANLTIKPVRVRRRKSMKEIIHDLKHRVREQEMVIIHLQATTCRLEEELKMLREQQAKQSRNRMMANGLGTVNTMSTATSSAEYEIVDAESPAICDVDAIEYDLDDLRAQRAGFALEMETIFEVLRDENDEQLQEELKLIETEIADIDTNIGEMQKVARKTGGQDLRSSVRRVVQAHRMRESLKENVENEKRAQFGRAQIEQLKGEVIRAQQERESFISIPMKQQLDEIESFQQDINYWRSHDCVVM